MALYALQNYPEWENKIEAWQNPILTNRLLIINIVERLLLVFAWSLFLHYFNTNHNVKIIPLKLCYFIANFPHGTNLQFSTSSTI